ncbi:MAG: amino acid ABC transporter ATP-binding protein [Firmicutes bacterium]|nr:amino acid ABC transporter ATP-binding protein [Bacillota bacterium]
MIILEHLQKKLTDRVIIDDISTVINDGDIISVIGASGSGKSTLLHLINLLERPTSGRIIVDGEEITKKGCNINKVRQKMGMVFQGFNLFGHLTAIENIMLAQTELLGKTRQQAYDRGMELLRGVGLEERALAYPDQLSGGQKQRVAIARALATDPKIIFFDEPTSALDHAMTGEVQAVIRSLAKTGKTMIIVSHELDFVRSVCNRVFYLDEGTVYEDGPPEQVFDAPVGEKTRRFVHKLKVLEISIKSKKFDFLAAGTEIDEYCEKNRISHAMTGHIRSVFEELCVNILLPVLKSPDILVTLEYSAQTQKIVLTADYNGEVFDPADTDDMLAYKVLTGITSSVVYEKTDGEYPNRVVVQIN